MAPPQSHRNRPTPAAVVAGAITKTYEAWRRGLKLAARTHYRTRFAECGRNVRFDPLTSSISYRNVRVGDNVFIGPGAIIGHATIGRDTMFGPNVHVRDAYHRFDTVGKTIQQNVDDNPGHVTIGEDVWVGEGSVLMRGADIGEGAVIGTKSMVTGRIAPYTVAVGTPARPIKARFSDEELREHLRLRGRTPETVEAFLEERREALADAT